MLALLPNAPPSPPFSSFFKEALVEMLAEAEAEIVALRRKLSSDGHVWAWKGDAAGLKQKTEGGKSLQFWSTAFETPIDSPPKTGSSSPLPSPRLPNELLRAVALQCDDNSLTSLTQVSFAFLEIASPILYHTLRIPVVNMDGRAYYGTELETFANATYSPSLATLLPRLSLGSVVHLQLLLLARYADESELEERDADDLQRLARRLRDDPTYREPLPPVPIPLLSLPNLQTLKLVASEIYMYITTLDLTLCIDLLLSFKNLSQLTFDMNVKSVDDWRTYQLDSELWRRCMGVWTQLERVKFKEVFVQVGEGEQEGGVGLPAMDPASIGRDATTGVGVRFEWELRPEQPAAGRSHVKNFVKGFRSLIPSVEEPWNRRAGGFGVVVTTEEDERAVRKEVRRRLKNPKVWELVQVVVA